MITLNRSGIRAWLKAQHAQAQEGKHYEVDIDPAWNPHLEEWRTIAPILLSAVQHARDGDTEPLIAGIDGMEIELVLGQDGDGGTFMVVLVVSTGGMLPLRLAGPPRQIARMASLGQVGIDAAIGLLVRAVTDANATLGSLSGYVHAQSLPWGSYPLPAAESGPSQAGSAEVMAAVVVPGSVQRRGQGYGLLGTYRAAIAQDRTPDRWITLKVDIERNAYDRQSHYRVLILTADGGWKVIHALLPEGEDMKGLPFYVLWNMDDRRAECVRAVEAVAERLVTETCEILRLT